jgi:hypothetical protein
MSLHSCGWRVGDLTGRGSSQLDFFGNMLYTPRHSIKYIPYVYTCMHMDPLRLWNFCVLCSMGVHANPSCPWFGPAFEVRSYPADQPWSSLFDKRMQRTANSRIACSHFVTVLATLDAAGSLPFKSNACRIFSSVRSQDRRR